MQTLNPGQTIVARPESDEDDHQSIRIAMWAAADPLDRAHAAVNLDAPMARRLRQTLKRLIRQLESNETQGVETVHPGQPLITISMLDSLDRQLGMIETRAELAIQAALKHGGTPQPINWADLGVVGVHWCRSRHRAWYCVEIEEAAPENWELSRFVADELAKDGWPDVEVRTEW
jgi:hypothetical protein